MKSLAKEDPSGMGPPPALERRVRVALLVAELVMNAMRRDPKDGPALERERGANGHQVLDPFGRLVAAVRKQAVVAHPDTHIDGEHVEDCHNRQARPAEEE